MERRLNLEGFWTWYLAGFGLDLFSLYGSLFVTPIDNCFPESYYVSSWFFCLVFSSLLLFRTKDYYIIYDWNRDKLAKGAKQWTNKKNTGRTKRQITIIDRQKYWQSNKQNKKQVVWQATKNNKKVCSNTE